MLQVSGAMHRRTPIRPLPTLAAAALCAALPLLGCGKQESASGKLLIKETIKVAPTEFALARAHDFDRGCERLYLQVPVRTLLRDATEQARNALADAAGDLEETPMTVRRWDYVLMHDRQNPKTYESIFIGEWRPAQRHGSSAGVAHALFAPVGCVASQSSIAIFELEAPFVEAAGSGPSQRSAAIVAKYSQVPPGAGESVERRTHQFATSDKANVGEAAAISVIIKEGDRSQAAPALSGNSSRN